MGERNKSDGKPYGGFYTQEDLKEVVAKATSLHITVVPEIEMPGHAAAAIAAYPQLGNSDIPKYDPKVASSWGVKYYTYAPKEETFAFIDDVFAELVPIFPSAYFHIGGDESPKTQWKNSPFAQSVMKRENLKDEHELQAYFVGRVEKLLNARGKKLIGWDEIQEGGLSKSATMMVWRDWKWAQLAADHGNQIVMSPTSHTYFDYSPGVRPKDPRFDVIGGNLSVEKVYSFEPIPPKFTAEQQKLVLGCQGQLWSEYIYNGAKLEYMAFPRVCALAEVAWSANKDRSWKEFEPRLDAHLKRLDGLKVNYHRNDGTPAVTDKLGRGE
jgi:hexosaminidase